MRKLQCGGATEISRSNGGSIKEWTNIFTEIWSLEGVYSRVSMCSGPQKIRTESACMQIIAEAQIPGRTDARIQRCMKIWRQNKHASWTHVARRNYLKFLFFTSLYVKLLSHCSDEIQIRFLSGNHPYTSLWPSPSLDLDNLWALPAICVCSSLKRRPVSFSLRTFFFALHLHPPPLHFKLFSIVSISHISSPNNAPKDTCTTITDLNTTRSHPFTDSIQSSNDFCNSFCLREIPSASNHIHFEYEEELIALSQTHLQVQKH